MDPLTILLGAAGIIGGFMVLGSADADKKREEEEKKRLAEEERDKAINYAEERLQRLANWLTPTMVIDSNVWMNKRYESFFECMRLACIIKQYKIELFGVQFEEISDIKKAFRYGEPQNVRARIATSRIDALHNENLLRIVPITVDAKRGAYADPLIVKVLAQQSHEGKTCTFFSDDTEIRVRVRQYFSDNAEADWQIIEVENYLGVWEKIISGIKQREQKEESEQVADGNPH